MIGTRRGYAVLALGVVLAGAAGWMLASPEDRRIPSVESDELVVYQSPACGCCRAWVDYMRTAGFRVRVERREEMVPHERELGVPSSLYACHTAVLGDVIVEGHVPASSLRRYLASGAPGRGLSVPGMQVGSPGMPADRPSSFSVFTFDDEGRTEVFERWRP